MALTPGTRLGVYEVTVQIGAGGMGEIYRARDMKLDRDVAIKILPDAFVSDAERVARFQREAKTLASLNHPNIGGIYGLEESSGVTALVMELVEGEDLSQRIARGAIPLDEALPIAKQVAEALEAAHEQGVIHRDLKPANIKVRRDGTVKILDFGLAKLTEVGGAPHVSQSPTITSPAMMTGVGMILGTAAYMSPEQARGKTVDKRADIWAFGCVLYEMLAGRRAFQAEDVSLTLAEVMKSEPNWSLLPALPPLLVIFLHQCLKKDPRQRAQSMGDVRLALEGAFDTAVPQTTASDATPAPTGRSAWVVAAAAVIAAAVLAIPTLQHLRERPPSSLPETRAYVDTPATTGVTPFALSPDGRQLVFVSSAEGQSRLWLRPLAATVAQLLPGTEGAANPFWSPDSRSVGFFVEAKLKRIDVAGGRPQSVAVAVTPRGGTWREDGLILFAPTGAGLFRVPASGGDAVAVTLDRETIQMFPFFLPGGRQFLFFVQGALDTPGIYLGSIDSAKTHRLTPADTAGVYLPPGWLLWVRDGTLVAQRLDLERKALTGDPVTLADDVAFDVRTRVAALSVSATGLVAYRTGGASRRQLAWFDRVGKALGTLGAPDNRDLSSPGLSPDGHRVVVGRTVQGNADIWLLDGTDDSRFTFDAAPDLFPIWSPDGSWIAFDSNRRGHRDLYRKRANGAGSEELLLESAQDKAAMSFSPNGRFLLYRAQDPTTRSDLWVLPLDGDRKPFVFLATPFDERSGAFSPDGKWVAYQSNASGPLEIYVRPFPASSAQWQISTSGGIQPRWRPDGKELYYIAPDGTLMAAAIAVQGGALQRGVPVALFQTRIWGGGTNANAKQQYDVTADGRFLIDVTSEDVTTTPITLLLNWHPEVKK